MTNRIKRKLMKAMVLSQYNHFLELKEIPIPKIGPTDILIKVISCGICGTDLKILEGKLSDIITLPHILGHEISGQIVDVGPKVHTLSVGDIGIVYPYVACKDCELCRTGRENICFHVKRFGFELPGGFSSYIRVPVYNFCKVPKSVQNIKDLAVLSDAGVTPYHALKEIGKVEIGQYLMVIGAGGLGLHAVQIGKLMGLHVAVVDPKESSRKIANTFGADLSVESIEKEKEKLIHWTEGKGVDIVLEGVGSASTFSWALSCLKRGGTLVLMGYDPITPISLNGKDMHYNEWKVCGTRLGKKQDLVEVLNLAIEGKLKPVVSQYLPMEEASRGLSLLQQGTTSGRIVLEGFSDAI